MDDVNELTEELVLDVHIMLRVANDVAVGSLNTVLRENAATPVGAAPDKLSIDCALIIQILRVHRRKRVLDVLPNWILWSLNTNQILIVTFTAFQT